VTLTERAHTNREWLNRELLSPQGSWWQFWEEISRGRPAYTQINKPLEVLASRADVRKGNIFSLPSAAYDLGTMFFVAESITTRKDEFRRAVRGFLRSLVPRAPFAAAFMRRSSGYPVGALRFPASSVDEDDIQRALADVAHIENIVSVTSHDLRDGYSGMMVATGRKK